MFFGISKAVFETHPLGYLSMADAMSPIFSVMSGFVPLNEPLIPFQVVRSSSFTIGIRRWQELLALLLRRSANSEGHCR